MNEARSKRCRMAGSRWGLAMAGLLLLLLGHGWGGWLQGWSAQVGRPVTAAAGVPGSARFVPVEIWADSGPAGLAAYQLELGATNGTVRVVGVEGGEAGAFQAAPYYDPAALAGGGRLILGAFTLEPGERLPTGRSRVARVHVLLEAGERAGFVVVAATAAGIEGQARTVRWEIREENQP